MSVYPGTNFRFTLENKGVIDLLLNPAERMRISGPDSLDYVLKQSGVPATLAPGALVYFYISFKPTTHGTRHAKLLIASNDLDENPYILNLSAEGLFPDIDVQQAGISPSFRNRDLQFWNSGNRYQQFNDLLCC